MLTDAFGDPEQAYATRALLSQNTCARLLMEQHPGTPARASSLTSGGLVREAFHVKGADASLTDEQKWQPGGYLRGVHPDGHDGRMEAGTRGCRDAPVL